MPERNDGAALAGVAVTILIADQVSKSLLLGLIGPGSDRAGVSLLGPWLELEYAQNRGAAFGLFTNLGSLLTVVSVAILIGLLMQFARQTRPPWWLTVATGAIVGGALGNVIDRLRLGYVVDFIAIGAWPNFNLADSAVTVGALLLCWGWLRTNGSGDTNPTR